MENISQQIQEIVDRRERRTGLKKQESNPFKCNKCKDKGIILKNNTVGNRNYETAIECKCEILQGIKNRKDNSGLGGLLDIRTFENYVAEEDFQKGIKNTAIEYTKEFIKGNRYSLSLLGQSGIGKTHILVAVARKLMDANINVKYYLADEITQGLNSYKFDAESYNLEFSKIANVGVLIIDDLFKSSIENYYNRESINLDDLKEIFKIINYRYNKNLPILLNSEIHFERFRDLDQAIIGRINEMCNDGKYLVSVRPDPKKNYRLNRKN